MLNSKKMYMLLLLIVIMGTLVIGCGAQETEAPAQPEASQEAEATQEPEAPKEVLKLKLANGEAIGADRDLSIVKFAELVEEKSNGMIKVDVFSGGTLGGWRDTIEGLEPGIVQVVVESIGTLESYSPTAAIDAYPFLYESIEKYEEIMFGETGKKILDTVGEEGGFVIMAPSYRGARVTTSTKKIETLADMPGFKLRAPGLEMYLKTWEGLGAAPIPMNISEVYTGIQQGTVMGQENPLAVCYANAFYEVCDYLIMTNHVISSDVFIYNDDFFNGLTEEQQTILTEAAEEAAAFRTKLVKDSESDYVEKFKAEGVEVVYPDVAAFADKLSNLAQDFPQIEDLVYEIKDAQK